MRVDRLLLIVLLGYVAFSTINMLGETPECRVFTIWDVLKELLFYYTLVWFAFDAGREHEREKQHAAGTNAGGGA